MQHCVFDNLALFLVVHQPIELNQSLRCLVDFLRQCQPSFWWWQRSNNIRDYPTYLLTFIGANGHLRAKDSVLKLCTMLFVRKKMPLLFNVGKVEVKLLPSFCISIKIMQNHLWIVPHHFKQLFCRFLSDPGPIIVYPSQWLTHSLTNWRHVEDWINWPKSADFADYIDYAEYA